MVRLPAFGRLLVAYSLNELAWSVGTIALSVLVYRRTGTALGSTAFFLCAQFAPAVLAPPAVARVDRMLPRRILPSLYWLEAVLFAVLAWMTQRFSLVPVLALALADGIVAFVARALATAARTEILKPADLLHEGNALTNVLFSSCYLAGPMIGGIVVAAGGTASALYADSALFAMMGLVLIAGALPGATGRAGPRTRRLRAAIARARTSPALARLIVLQGIGLVFFTISIPVEVVFATRSLHAGARGYGALLTVWGGGAILGSIVYARFSRRGARPLLASTAAAVAVGFGIMAAAPNLTVALIGAAAGGIANGVGDTAFQTEIQARTPQDWMALITSLAQSVAQLAPGLGIVLGGAITDLANPRVALAVAAVGALAYAIVLLVVLAPRRDDGSRPGVRLSPL